jgi:hypothetical protein
LPGYVVILSIPDSFHLDLNNDIITDFEFKKFSRLVACGGRSSGATTRVNYDVEIGTSDTSNAVMTDGSVVLSLDSSTMISPDSLWATASRILLSVYSTVIPPCIPSIGGYWINVSDKYIGLKFIKNNKTYYGWARLSSTYAESLRSCLLISGQLILKDYAYNSIPGQPILAGQTE